MVNFDINEHIFKFVFSEAMRDATLQKSYNGKKNELLKGKKAKNVRQKLLAHLTKIVDGDYALEGKQTVYDKEFKTLAKSICSIYDSSEFTFGNAQKLINMVIKHFYFICFNSPKMKENFKYCHCPMDSKMIAIVARNYRSAIKNGIADKSLLSFKKSGEESTAWSSVSWSKIHYTDCEFNLDVYEKFQDMVRHLASEERVNSIEYDYIHFPEDE